MDNDNGDEGNGELMCVKSDESDYYFMTYFRTPMSSIVSRV